MTKKNTIFLFGVLAFLVFFVVLILRQSLLGLLQEEEGPKNIAQNQSVSEKFSKSVRDVSVKAQHVPVVTSFQDMPSSTDPGLSNEAQIEDVRRSANEDGRMLAKILSLSEDQQKQIVEKLENLRRTIFTEVSDVTEYDLITSVLTPEQKTVYETYLEEQRRSDARLLATNRLHMIELVTGPLSDDQEDAIFQAVASSIVDYKVISDADILREHLTESQFLLWSQSSDASPVEINE